jgi:hypothetical protein
MLALYPIWLLYPLLLLGAVAIGMPADMNEDATSAIEWTRTKLTPKQNEFLGRLPLVEGQPVTRWPPATAGRVTAAGSWSRASPGCRC